MCARDLHGEGNEREQPSALSRHATAVRLGLVLVHLAVSVAGQSGIISKYGARSIHPACVNA